MKIKVTEREVKRQIGQLFPLLWYTFGLKVASVFVEALSREVTEGSGGIDPHFLNVALEGGGKRHAATASPPGQRGNLLVGPKGRRGIKLGIPGPQLSSPFYFNINRNTKFNPSCGQLRELKREANKGKKNACLLPEHSCVEVFFEFFSLNCPARKQGYGRPTYPLDKRSLMFVLHCDFLGNTESLMKEVILPLHWFTRTCRNNISTWETKLYESSCLYRASTVLRHYFITPNWCKQL
jgi:hypothetical protein